eukprot:TRINITY_DN16383_c0_g1_i2.p1 TRINITY_DN16383_c0_g1~~TRINITY_DN16383_c0_g1_i2.p1  ORF type:complete len:158 (-),score=27.48 TRINITY_DN16383_c0_g1_i2:174-647(-)
MCIRDRAVTLCQFFFFKQKTAYEIMPSLVGSEMCIRDRYMGQQTITNRGTGSGDLSILNGSMNDSRIGGHERDRSNSRSSRNISMESKRVNTSMTSEIPNVNDTYLSKHQMKLSKVISSTNRSVAFDATRMSRTERPNIQLQLPARVVDVLEPSTTK